MCAGVYLCIHVCVSGISGRLGWDLVEISWGVQRSAGCGLGCFPVCMFCMASCVSVCACVCERVCVTGFIGF